MLKQQLVLALFCNSYNENTSYTVVYGTCGGDVFRRHAGGTEARLLPLPLDELEISH